MFGKINFSKERLHNDKCKCTWVLNPENAHLKTMILINLDFSFGLGNVTVHYFDSIQNGFKLKYSSNLNGISQIKFTNPTIISTEATIPFAVGFVYMFTSESMK